MKHELTDEQAALVDALSAQTAAGKLPWTMVTSFPVTFIARVRNNTFVLCRDVDDYPDLLAFNSAYAVVIRSIRNVPLWSRVADSFPPMTLEPERQLIAIRGMTLMVKASEGTD